MTKISIAFAMCGLALLLFSVLPWSTQSTNTVSSLPAIGSSDALDGKALFSAKGCAQCHHHSAVAGSGKFAGAYGATVPDLTTYRRDKEFLRRWLKDPSAVKPGTEMPTLGLSDAEIEALITFLSTSQDR